jgi:hypothetical protein
MPLERDEGEYALAGRLLLEGVAPFRELYTMKLPGASAAYAAAMALFGQTPTGVRLGLLVANAAAVVLVFLLGRRLLGRAAGVLAAAWFAAASLSASVFGFAAHATQFLTPFALSGIYLLVAAERSGAGRTAAAGALLGVATLMKQSGAAFFALALVLVLLEARRDGARVRWHPIAALTAGFAAPLLLLFAALAAAGTLPTAYFWTVAYAREYAALTTPAMGWTNLRLTLGDCEPGFRLLLVLALFGAALPDRFTGADRRGGTVLRGLLLAGAAAAAAGLYFRAHYLVTLLPGAALGGAALVAALWRVASATRAALPRALSAAGTLAAAVVPLLGVILGNVWLFFDATPEQASADTYTSNPFTESAPLADYLRARTSSGERVAVFGSEPQILFLAGRRPATGYIYMYPLMEPQPYARQMQDQMIAEVERARPRYLVVVHSPYSWGADARSDRHLLDWLAEYRRGYTRVAVAEQEWEGRTRTGIRYVWDEREAASFRSRRAPFTEILRRSDALPEAARTEAPGGADR